MLQVSASRFVPLRVPRVPLSEPRPRSFLRKPITWVAIVLIAGGLWLASATARTAARIEPDLGTPASKIWSDETGLPRPSGLTVGEFETHLHGFLKKRDYVTRGFKRDKGIRDTGPFIDGTYYGTHPAVRVYYSPGMIDWLEAGRVGEIPDGACVIKEQYPPPAARHAGKTESQLRESLESWTVMVKDSAGSVDGWFWSNPGAHPVVNDNTKYPFDHAESGFGLYCVRCHGSTQSPSGAASNEFTFSALRNIEGYPGEPILFRVDDSWRKATESETAANSSLPDHVDIEKLLATVRYAEVPHPTAGSHPCVRPGTPGQCTPHRNAAFMAFHNQYAPQPRVDVAPLPPETMDVVCQNPDGTRDFLTSNQCMSCHAGLTKPYGPTMFIPTGESAGYGAEGWNVSPHGQWRWTPMGLAGRDPVFYAQVESELVLLNREFPADTAAQIGEQLQNTCLRCHGAMGHHQNAADHPGRPMTLDMATSANKDSPHGSQDNLYGALARDGISCMVCHRAQPLPQQPGDMRGDLQHFLETQITGNLHFGDVGELFGPYADKGLKPYVMQHATAIKPRHGDYINNSRMCGSCHTVSLPAVDNPLTAAGRKASGLRQNGARDLPTPVAGGDPGASRPSAGGDSGASRPSAGGDPGASRPAVGRDPGASRPSVGGDPGALRLSAGGDPGASRPSVGGDPGASRPSVGGDPGALRPSVGRDPGASRPSVGGDPGALRPSAGGDPGALLPSAGGDPGALRPSAGGDPGASRPSAGGDPGALRPSAGGDPGALRPSAGEDPTAVGDDSSLIRGESVDAFKDFHHHLEQATYLEWLNSDYQTEYGTPSSAARSCQDCHMSPGVSDPATGLEIDQIETRVAAIQDATYPDAENLTSHKNLDLPIRDQYRRHNFAGLNLFLLEMFNQQDEILGVRRADYMTGSSQEIEHAVTDFLNTARHKTARLRLETDWTAQTNTLVADVDVQNLAGHRFPSGVGFRRAFIELTVRRGEDVVWSSGATDSAGVLIGPDGKPLPEETFAIGPDGQPSYHRHHETITSPTQVMVYETLMHNHAGDFTTSFVHGCVRVKDNRLLPRGWRAEGPEGGELTGVYLKATQPGAEAMSDPRYRDGSGTDRVRYHIDLTGAPAAGELSVTATLHYQAIPPYFLKAIFDLSAGPAARRLHHLCANLDLRDTAIADWKLPVASASEVVMTNGLEPLAD